MWKELQNIRFQTLANCQITKMLLLIMKLWELTDGMFFLNGQIDYSNHVYVVLVHWDHFDCLRIKIFFYAKSNVSLHRREIILVRSWNSTMLNRHSCTRNVNWDLHLHECMCSGLFMWLCVKNKKNIRSKDYCKTKPFGMWDYRWRAEHVNRKFTTAEEHSVACKG